MDSMVPAREQALTKAREALQRGIPEHAAKALYTAHAANPGDAEIGRLLGFALRGAQRLDEAQAVFEALSGDPVAKLGSAQTAYERGLPAAALFSEAAAALPGELELLRNRAAALLSEGEGAAAEALLSETLATHPGWLDGHKALATLRWTGGDAFHFADSYTSAVLAQPRNGALWLAWFATVAQTRAWTSASDILDCAEAAIGKTPGVLASRFFLASESGDMSTADALFVSTLGIEGDTTSLTRLRYLIRRGRFADAEALALRLTATPSGTLFWPWLSLIWRLSGDARHLWLDNPDVFIRSVVVDLSAADYAELADLLRGLHVMQRPYVEQSVRGGTQTDRSVMLRHEPILQKTRSAWIDAIRGYVATMPPFEAEHPLLGTPREQLLIEGSWSVRLLRKGHNVPHTHPRGWLSTAFYIALPDADVMGPVPAGHIAFGTPPDGLGIDLPPYRTIAPVIGQSAVFPSTMWHSTVPFDDGERLVLALDVRRPTY